MMEPYANAMSRYAQFEGRSNRSEFWLFFLTMLAIYLTAAIMGEAIGIGARALLAFVNIVHIMPQTAIGVRRLHDTDRSGWWILIGAVPIVGQIVLIIFLCGASTPGTNRFGPSPMGNAGPGPAQIPTPSNVDVIQQLEKLASLRASGAIDDHEFQRMKSGLMSRA